MSTHILHGTKHVAGVEVLPRDAAGHPGDQVIQNGRVQRRVLLALMFCTADMLPLVLQLPHRSTGKSLSRAH